MISMLRFLFLKLPVYRSELLSFFAWVLGQLVTAAASFGQPIFSIHYLSSRNKAWYVGLGALPLMFLLTFIFQQGQTVVASDSRQKTLSKRKETLSVTAKTRDSVQVVDNLDIDPLADFVVIADVDKLVEQFPDASNVNKLEAISKCDDGTRTMGSVDFSGKLRIHPVENRDAAIIRVRMNGTATTQMRTRSGNFSIGICGSAVVVGDVQLLLHYGQPTTIQVGDSVFRGSANLRKTDVKILRPAIAPGLLKRVASRVVQKKIPEANRDFCNELVANVEEGLMDEVRSLDIASYQRKFEATVEKFGFSPISVSTTKRAIALQMTASGIPKNSAAQSSYRLKFEDESEPNITALLSGNTLLRMSRPEAFQMGRTYEYVPLEGALTSLEIISLYPDGSIDPVELADQSFAVKVGSISCTLVGRRLSLQLPISRDSKPWGALTLAYQFESGPVSESLPASRLSTRLVLERFDSMAVSPTAKRLENQLNKLAVREPTFDLKSKLQSVIDAVTSGNGLRLALKYLHFSEDDAWIETQFVLNAQNGS